MREWHRGVRKCAVGARRLKGRYGGFRSRPEFSQTDRRRFLYEAPLVFQGGDQREKHDVGFGRDFGHCVKGISFHKNKRRLTIDRT